MEWGQRLLLIGPRLFHQILSVQQARNAKLAVSDVEGMVQVFHVLARLQRLEVEEVRTVSVNERIEAQTGTPR